MGFIFLFAVYQNYASVQELLMILAQICSVVIYEGILESLGTL